MGAIAFGIGHPLLQIADQLAQGEGDAQIDDAHDDQALECLVGGAFDDVVLGHQIAYIEGGGQGGLLQDHNELIAQSRQNVPHCLGQNDPQHGLPFAQAQAPGGFCLALVHGLDAAPDHFRYIGGRVDTQRNGGPGEIAKLNGNQGREGEDENEQLQQNGGAADHFDVHRGDETDDAHLGHFHHCHHGAQHNAQRNGQCRQL